MDKILPYFEFLKQYASKLKDVSKRFLPSKEASKEWFVNSLKGKNKIGAAIVYSTATYTTMRLAMAIYNFNTKKSFKGKIVVVTGGASGIGKLMCRNLLERDAIVVIWDINADAVTDTLKEFRNLIPGCKIHGYKVDVSNRTHVYETHKRMKERFCADGGHTHIHAIINNAGIVAKKTLLKATDQEVLKVMNVNCMSHMWTIKAFLPDMVKNNEGHVVCISSGAGFAGIAGMNTYCASKFGVFGLTESLRLQMKNERRNVDTLIVCPYFIDTGMFDGVKSPLIPILKPEYVAKSVIDGMEKRTNTIYLPDWTRMLVYGLRFTFPSWFQDEIQRFLGTLSCMDEVLLD